MKTWKVWTHAKKEKLGSVVLWLLAFSSESSPNLPCIALGKESYVIEYNTVEVGIVSMESVSSAENHMLSHFLLLFLPHWKINSCLTLTLTCGLCPCILFCCRDCYASVMFLPSFEWFRWFCLASIDNCTGTHRFVVVANCLVFWNLSCSRVSLLLLI